jgi:hypothetical protein
MHPLVLLKKTPIAMLIGASPLLPMAPIKGVEFARFGNRLVIVNHRSSPVNIGGISAKRALAQIPSAPGWLAAHSAVWFELGS